MRTAEQRTPGCLPKRKYSRIAPSAIAEDREGWSIVAVDGVIQTEESHPPRGDQDETLSTLFPRVAATTIVALSVARWLRDGSNSKSFDRVAFAVSLLAAALWILKFRPGPTSYWSRCTAFIVCLVGFLVGIARVERPGLTSIYWEGFGLSVALAASLLALIVVPVTARVRHSWILRQVLLVSVIALAACDGLSLFRDLRNFSDSVNNSFVLNEVLAPAAGRVPGANFIPQYSQLFGWSVDPMHHLMSAHSFADGVVILLSLCSVASLGLGAFVARRCLPKHSLWLALALTVPLTTVTVLHNGIESSIGSYLQELPIRIFPAMLYSIFAISSFVTLLHRSLHKVPLCTLGLFGGIMLWNSQDFGLAVPLAYFVILLLASRGPIRRQAVGVWLAGLVLGLLSYPLLTLALGHPLRWS